MMNPNSLCAIRRGLFFKRACTNPVAGVCSACGRPVCGEHLAMRIPQMMCVDCNAARTPFAGTGFRDRGFSDRTSVSGSSSGSDTPAFEGQGGQFGGGGATGSWDADDADKAGFDSSREDDGEGGAAAGAIGAGSGFDAS